MSARILILGDLYPNNIKSYPKLPDTDFCIANLECAITNESKAVKKDGPSLKISPENTKIIKELGVDLVGLANNHTCDYGISGLNETISNLKANNISYFGLLPEYVSCSKTINNKKVGFYFVTEHQYNFFDKEGIGANVLDLDRCFNEVSTLKSNNDFVLVLFHGGKEYYEYPTPLQQRICHKFVDNGANIVICQHSHCIGSEEKYLGSTILYGQGNFIFPYSENNFFKTGLLVDLYINDDNSYSVQYLPTIHEKPGIIEFASPDTARKLLKELEVRSAKLSHETAEKLYDLFVEKEGLDFLYRLFNKSRFYVRLDTSRLFKSRMIKRYLKRNQKYLLYYYNYFNCETHVEYIKAILDKQIQREDKK